MAEETVEQLGRTRIVAALQRHAQARIGSRRAQVSGSVRLYVAALEAESATAQEVYDAVFSYFVDRKLAVAAEGI